MLKKISLFTAITLIIGIAALQAAAESISGTVADNTGQNLVQNCWVQIEAWNADNGNWHDTWADCGDGNYHLGLYPGEWHVWVNVHETSGYWGSTTKEGEEGQPKYVVTVSEGDELSGYNFGIDVDDIPPVIDDIQVEGTPKAGEDIVISAEITDDGGSTVNPFWVHIVARRIGETDHWDWYHMGLDVDGRRRGHISSDRVTTAGVEYFIEAGDYAQNWVTNPPNGWENPLLEETIDPSDATISGTVTDEGDNPLEDAQVGAQRHEDGCWAYAQTGGNGNYTLEVAAGAWTIEVVNLYEYYPVNPPHRVPGDPYGFQGLYLDIPVGVGDNLTGYDVTMAHDPTPPEIWFDDITVLPSNGITISVHVEDPESGVYSDAARFYYRFIDWDWGWDDRQLEDWKYDPIEDRDVRDGVFEYDIHFGRTGIIEYFFESWNAAGGVSGTNPSPRPSENPKEEPHGNYAVVIAGYTLYTANYRDKDGNTTFNGELIGPGTIISAANPDGVLCGGFVTDVTNPQANPGEYGYMTIYGDDPDTGDFDEGMSSGETPTFFIFDEVNRINTRVNIISGDATWQQDTFPAVDLAGASVMRKIIELERNWNLIGIGGEPYDEDTSVQSMLRSINGEYGLVIGYDETGAIIYDPEEDPSFNTMTDVDDVHGFYIFMYNPAMFNHEILPTLPSTPIAMLSGWNLPCYLPEDERDVATALNSIDGMYDWVKALYPQSGGFRIYNPDDPGHSTLQNMKQPFSYFILMNQDADLTYDAPPAAPSVHTQPPSVVQRDVIPSTSMMFFYGEITIDGQPAPKGTVVTTFDPDGVKIGKFVMREAGKFGYMPAYQDEDATPNLDEGANPGDVITFYINGQPAVADKATTWTKFGDKIKLNLRLSKSSEMVIPEKFALWQNYPNPFNPETWLPYQLAQNAEVAINIYDVKGQLVHTFYLGQQPAGMYLAKEKAAYWDGKNEVGERVSSGVYFYTIRAGEFTATRRMVIVK